MLKLILKHQKVITRLRKEYYIYIYIMKKINLT